MPTEMNVHGGALWRLAAGGWWRLAVGGLSLTKEELGFSRTALRKKQGIVGGGCPRDPQCHTAERGPCCASPHTSMVPLLVVMAWLYVQLV